MMFMRMFGHPVLTCRPGAFECTGLYCNLEGEPGGGGGGGSPGGTPAPVTAPWGGDVNKTWMVGEAANAKPWFETFVPEGPTRDLMKAKNYANPTVMADAYYNLNKITSTEESGKLLVPGKDAKPEDWNGVYNKLGRPATPDLYEFKPAEGVKHDEGMVKFAKPLFHEAGLSATQANKIVAAWDKFQGETAAAATAKAATDNEAALKAVEKTWGADLEKNKAAGDRVIKSLGLEDTLLNGIEAHIGAAPLVELLARIGRASDEGTFKGGGTNTDPTNPDSMTPDQAGAEITRLNGNAEFQAKYTDPKHAENKASIERMNRLYARAGNKAPV